MTETRKPFPAGTKWAWEEAGMSRLVGKKETRSGRDWFNQVGVLHTTENSLTRSSARGVADWQNTQQDFIDRAKTEHRFSGYHFLVDRKSWVTQCNPDTTEAFHAGKSFTWHDKAYRHGVRNRPGEGNDQLGVAMVARAHKMPYAEQEQDFEALLDQTATLLAHIKEQWDIPLVKITTHDYRAGDRGWLGHQDVANHPVGRKSDPGEHFPWDDLMTKANAEYERIYANKVKPSGGDAETAKLHKSLGPKIKVPDDKDTTWVAELSADEAKWLEDFIRESRKRDVLPSSLAALTAAYRRLRTELGLDDKTSVNQVIDDLMKRIDG